MIVTTARLFLIVALTVNLTVAAIGYAILPDQIYSRGSFENEFGPPPNPYSKPYFFGMLSGAATFVFLLGIGVSYFSLRFAKPGNESIYWEREENYRLKNDITCICLLFSFAVVILFFSYRMFAHFSVNLSTPPKGDARSLFAPLVVFFLIIPLLGTLLPRLILWSIEISSGSRRRNLPNNEKPDEAISGTIKK